MVVNLLVSSPSIKVLWKGMVNLKNILFFEAAFYGDCSKTSAFIKAFAIVTAFSYWCLTRSSWFN